MRTISSGSMVGPILIPLYEGLISQLSNWQLSSPPPPKKNTTTYMGFAIPLKYSTCAPSNCLVLSPIQMKCADVLYHFFPSSFRKSPADMDRLLIESLKFLGDLGRRTGECGYGEDDDDDDASSRRRDADRESIGVESPVAGGDEAVESSQERVKASSYSNSRAS